MTKMKSLGMAVGAAVIAVFAAVSCGNGSNSEVTKVTGIIAPEDVDRIEAVEVAVEKYGIDTIIPVVNGKFYVELPADPTEVALVLAGNYHPYFILDGTKLTVNVAEDFTVTSSSKNSLQNKYNDFESEVATKNSDFVKAVTDIAEGEGSLSDEEKDFLIQQIYANAVDEIADFLENTAYENRDNAISAIALNKLQGIVPDDQMSYLISLLSDEMQENTFIIPLLDEVETSLATAEGNPFRDFTIEDSDGKTVSLSDYVGRGKYVLVDFWASWCEPCKQEIPYIREAYNKYRSKGFDVVSIAVSDDPQDSKDTAKFYNMNWNLIVNAGQIPIAVYGFSSIPYIILFGPDGTILKKDLRGAGISEEISKYID